MLPLRDVNPTRRLPVLTIALIVINIGVFLYQQQGLDSMGRAVGRFVATGVRPSFAARLAAQGLDLHPALFARRVLLKA